MALTNACAAIFADSLKGELLLVALILVVNAIGAEIPATAAQIAQVAEVAVQVSNENRQVPSQNQKGPFLGINGWVETHLYQRTGVVLIFPLPTEPPTI
jgi:hypothetical protein